MSKVNISKPNITSKSKSSPSKENMYSINDKEMEN